MSNFLGVATDDALNGSQAAVSSITVGASPFSYVATVLGAVNIAAGTVSQVAIKRKGVSTNLGGIAGNFHTSKGDIIVVTYTAAPTMVFIPN